MNNVGVLPLDYLQPDLQFQAQALATNARQIYAQYARKAGSSPWPSPRRGRCAHAAADGAGAVRVAVRAHTELKKESHLFFAPFPELDEQRAATELAALDAALAGGQYPDALQIANGLIALSLRGLHYYQTYASRPSRWWVARGPSLTGRKPFFFPCRRPAPRRYDWAFLRSIVSAGYLGWIAYTLAFMVRSFTVWGNDGVLLMRAPAAGRTPPPALSRAPWIAAAAVGAVAALYLAVTAAPPLYYVYIAFPIFFWAAVFAEARVWWTPLRQHARRGGLARIAGVAAVFIAGMEVLVATYFERRLLTAMFYALAAWPLVWPKELRRQRAYLWVAWSAACCLTAQFTLLPVVSDEHTHLVYVLLTSPWATRRQSCALAADGQGDGRGSLGAAQALGCAGAGARRASAVRHAPPLDRLGRRQSRRARRDHRRRHRRAGASPATAPRRGAPATHAWCALRACARRGGRPAPSARWWLPRRGRSTTPRPSSSAARACRSSTRPWPGSRWVHARPVWSEGRRQR